jgi:predicted DNA binding protein
MTNILNTRRKSILSLALAVLVLGSAGSAVTFTASAAGSTTVSLSPAEQQIETGETTTYEIVVENTDGGIGTTDAAVALDDPSVGSITDLTIAGEPANQNVAIADDGSSVDFNAIYFGNALPDNPDGVVIATVTVEGTAAGSSDLSLDVTEISDAAGDVYEVTGTEGASLAVGDQETTIETETPTATPTATETETATATETPTATETTTETQTTTATTTETATETTAATQTATETESATETETETTTLTETTAETETTTEEGERTLDAGSIADSLSDSGLSAERAEGVGSALGASDLTDEEITTVTDALAGDALTDTQREAVASAVESGDLTKTQLAALGDALDDGSLSEAERTDLGFLGTSGDERTLDEGAITDALADSDLDDTQTDGVSTVLGASDLTDGEITTVTDALAGDALTDAQREAVADAIAGGDLTDDQSRVLVDALSDGQLTDAERNALGFLGEGEPEATYYQVDFVVGEPIENLRGPNGTYQNDELLRFAHGSTDEPITRRSEGEFVTDHMLADRIESRNITVTNDTATTTFTVADGESVTLTLASYEKTGPGWSPATEAQQTFVDSETRTFESGTHTLTADLPDEDDTSGDDDGESN